MVEQLGFRHKSPGVTNLLGSLDEVAGRVDRGQKSMSLFPELPEGLHFHRPQAS